MLVNKIFDDFDSCLVFTSNLTMLRRINYYLKVCLHSYNLKYKVFYKRIYTLRTQIQAFDNYIHNSIRNRIKTYTSYYFYTRNDS